MKKPEKKHVMPELTKAGDVLANRESFRMGYNQACDDWEKWNKTWIKRYNRIVDGLKIHWKLYEDLKNSLPSEEEIEQIIIEQDDDIKECPLCLAKAIYKRLTL